MLPCAPLLEERQDIKKYTKNTILHHRNKIQGENSTRLVPALKPRQVNNPFNSCLVGTRIKIIWIVMYTFEEGDFNISSF